MSEENKKCYFGINNDGEGRVFSSKEKLEEAGFTFCKEVKTLNFIQNGKIIRRYSCDGSQTT